MGVKVVFRCEHCDVRPDRLTQRTLERQVRDRTLGQFLDAQPGGWLIWSAGGPFGARRYVCAEHREQLIGYVKRHHGRSGVSDVEPFPALWPDGFSALRDREIAELLGGGPRRDPADILDAPTSVTSDEGTARRKRRA